MPLFVSGYPRSGTTLLQAVLATHGDIALAQNTGVCVGLTLAGVTFDGAIEPDDRLGVLLDMAGEGMARRHLGRLEPAVVHEYLTAPGAMSFRAAYELLAPRLDAPLWGEKGHFDVFYVAQLAALYPDAKFVHIVRDPRAALLSQWRKQRAGGEAELPALGRTTSTFFVGRALEWRAYRMAERQSREAVGDERFFSLRYEDLVTDTEALVRRLCAFLEVPFEAAMLDVDARLTRSGVGIDGRRAEAHRNVARPIDAGRASGGQALPAWARRIVEQEAGPELEAAGYAPSADDLDDETLSRIDEILAERRRPVVRKAQGIMAKRLATVPPEQRAPFEALLADPPPPAAAPASEPEPEPEPAAASGRFAGLRRR